MGDAAQRERLGAGNRRAQQAERDLPDLQPHRRYPILSAERAVTSMAIMAIVDFPVCGGIS
jgi:hypothetical protein